MAPIRFGIPLYRYQVLDVAGGIDTLALASASLLKEQGELGFCPADLHERGLDIEFYHILDPNEKSESRVTKLPLENYDVQATTTCADCPPLDYLLFGGPMPDYKLSAEMINFVKDCAAKSGFKGIFTTCTGGAVLAQTGLLDGRRAVVNFGLVPLVRQLYPAVNWVEKSEGVIWVEDGNIWTASSACTGMDMFAHWLLDKCGKDIAEFVFESLGLAPRGVDGKLISI